MNKVNFEKTADLINKQDEWRDRCINLIASENVQSKKVRSFAGSDFTHRYAEGHPGERYYKGTNFIDQIESDLKLNLKNIFKCEHTEVRPISGTNSNEAIFSKFVNKEDIVMANSTPGGGHISHHRLGALGKFTKNIIDFPLTADGYHLDIEKTKDLINRIKPKMIVLGKSLFLFPEPIAELRDVCEQNKTKIIYDGAHVLGLIAGKCFQDPLGDGALMVSASTHKTYFGSQRGLILSNMDDESWRKVDRGAFPGSSSNHHLGTLAQMALSTVEFMEFGDQYASQVIKNAKHLAVALEREGFCVAAKDFGYTESHQVALNVNEYGGGSLISTLLEQNDIILNMNMLPHEPLKNHNNPEGLRIGVAEMTRYGMNEPEMEKIAELMKEVVIEKKSVKEEVNKLRDGYQDVKYSFDSTEA
jgi:glycine hydroxymethyltransferase